MTGTVPGSSPSRPFSSASWRSRRARRWGRRVEWCCDRDHAADVVAQGRSRRRRGAARRQRLQRAGLQGPEACRARARDQRTRRRGEDRRRLRAEHDDARASGLRPDHRGRLRAGRRHRRCREEVSRHELRDRRRRPVVSQGQAEDVQGLLFREEQVGYLVGYLGALEAEKSGTSRSALLGASRSRRSIASSRATRPAQKRPSRGRRSRGRTRSTGRTRRSARSSRSTRSPRAQGRVQVAAGVGWARLAAKDQGVWGIGVDGDQSFLGPHVLTSALKGVDSAVFLTIKSVEDDDFAGGKNVVFGIDQEGVGLGTLSPKADKDDVAKVEQVEQKIADGEIADIPTTVN